MKTDMAALLHREIISVFAVEYIFALIQLVSETTHWKKT